MPIQTLICSASLRFQPVELVGLRQRVFCGIVIEYFFVLGELYLTLVAFLLRDWRAILWAITAPIVVCAAYSPFLPESPRFVTQKILNSALQYHTASWYANISSENMI